MSTKQSGKLQALEQTDDNEASSEEPKESTKACGFAALIGSDTDENCDDAGGYACDNSAVKPEPAQAVEVSSKQRKAKKKKKKKRNSENKQSDTDEGEESVLEAALAQAAQCRSANSTHLAEEGSSCVLALAKPFFNADRERRRLFKVKTTLLSPGTKEPRKGIKLRGINEGRFLHYRRLFLVEPTPDDGWPRPDGCAKMVPDESQCFRIETTPEHSKVLLEFAACSMLHDPQMIHNFLMEYPFCVEGLLVYSEIARQSGEHQQAFQILRRAVYATECGFDGAFSPFQETQVPMLRGEACCSISWPRVRVQLAEDPSWPGWSWFTTLWGYMLALASQGLPRTAFEVCKLILAMTLPNDPTHSLVHLDYFALRAEEYDVLLEISEKLNPPCPLPNNTIVRLDFCLPNFAYSAALAHYLRRSIKDEDEAAALSTISVQDLTTPPQKMLLQPTEDGPSPPHLALMRAMLLFPRTLRSILETLGISLNASASGSPCKLSWSELLDRSPLKGETHILHQQHFLAHALVSDAFVQRCATFFRSEKMLRWLHACTGRLVQMCESSLFEQELMAVRRSWSEAPLAIASAMANDYKDFSAAEVGAERKAPRVLEEAINSLMGSGPVVVQEPEDEEAQLQRALRASQAAEDAQERRRLIEEQDEEFRQSLATDAACTIRLQRNKFTKALNQQRFKTLRRILLRGRIQQKDLRR